MNLNGKNIDAYNALVYRYNLPQMSFESSYLHLDEVFLLMAQKQVGANGFLEILVFGRTQDEVTRNASGLKAQLKQCTIRGVDDSSFFYEAIALETNLDHKGVDVQSGLNVGLFTVNLYVYDKYSGVHSHKQNTPHKFYYDGTTETSPVLEITPIDGPSDLTITINGEHYLIQDVIKNETIVIDCAAKTVMAAGQNKMKDVRFHKFPKLKPGLNTIETSATCEVGRSYKVRWL